MGVRGCWCGRLRRFEVDKVYSKPLLPNRRLAQKKIAEKNPEYVPLMRGTLG
jgi:hypothetical protein